MTLTTVAIIASIASLANFVLTLLCAVRIRKFATEVNDFAHEIISKTDAFPFFTSLTISLTIRATWRFSKVKK